MNGQIYEVTINLPWSHQVGGGRSWCQCRGGIRELLSKRRVIHERAMPFSFTTRSVSNFFWSKLLTRRWDHRALEREKRYNYIWERERQKWFQRLLAYLGPSFGLPWIVSIAPNIGKCKKYLLQKVSSGNHYTSKQ